MQRHHPAQAAPAGPNDGQSFQSELDRAQNQGSTPQADSGDSQPTAAGPGVQKSTEQTEAQSPGKTAGPAKGAGKARIRLIDKPEAALAKGGTAKSPLKTDPESNAGSSDAGNSQQKESTPDRKPPKKTAPLTDVSATAASMAASATTPLNQAAVPVAKAPETPAAPSDKKLKAIQQATRLLLRSRRIQPLHRLGPISTRFRWQTHRRNRLRHQERNRSISKGRSTECDEGQ